MDFSFGQIMLGLLFGAIGMGMFMFGKRAQRIPHLVAGIVLMAFPYFVTNLILMSVIGAGVTAAPFFIRE